MTTGTGSILMLSAVCETCLELRLEEERRSQLHYSKAVIYIRQVCPGDAAQNKSSGQMDADAIVIDQAPEGGDPDFQVTISIRCVPQYKRKGL